MSDKKRFAMMFILLLSVFLSAAEAQGIAASSYSFNVSIRVPVLLEISVDQPLNSALLLSGRYGSNEINEGHFPGQRIFEIRKDSHIQLGPANLFSNINGRYCILITSQNDGILEHDPEFPDRAIPYKLLINGTSISSKAGRFEYETFGKSVGGGTSFDVAIDFGEVPDGLPAGIYSDRLAFSVVAR